MVCTHDVHPQCAVRAMLGTNVRPPLGTCRPFPMDSLLLWSLAMCRNAFAHLHIYVVASLHSACVFCVHSSCSHLFLVGDSMRCWPLHLYV